MADLHTEHLGLELRNPVVLSACPLSEDAGTLRELEEAGIGAVVLRSLFEEQIESEAMELHGLLEEWSDSYLEAQSFFPPLVNDFRTGPETYLELVEAARRTLSVPVIASLNGVSPGGWTRYARYLEEAGAQALELNIYAVAADLDVPGTEIERRYVEIVSAVRSTVSLPLAVKIGPFFSSLPHFAVQLIKAGADGLVLFNRFLQPDIDLDDLSVRPEMKLSSPEEFRLPLRWIAILYGRIEASLAATSGAHTAAEVLKGVAAGASAVMMASALLKNGPHHVAAVVAGVEEWLDKNGYISVEQMKGSLSQLACPDPSAFERAHYMQGIESYRPSQPPLSPRRISAEARFRGPRA